MQGGVGDRTRETNRCKSIDANGLANGEKRLGVFWECADGRSRHDLTCIVTDPQLSKIVKAWPEIDHRLRDVLVSLVEISK